MYVCLFIIMDGNQFEMKVLITMNVWDKGKFKLILR
jgi:hypothetical protein